MSQNQSATRSKPAATGAWVNNTSFNWSHVMLRTAHQHGHRRSRLGVEALEDRRCMSTVVAFDNASSTLTITGDDNPNQVKIVHDDPANKLHVLHDGQDEVFVSSAVQNIVVDLKGRADSLTETLQEGTNFFRGKSVDINMGWGPDSAIFDLKGNSNFWATLKEDLTIKFNSGAGADTVRVDVPQVEIGNHLYYYGLLGAGADHFDAIGYGGIGAQGGVVIDVRAEAGPDVLNYFGTYNPQAPAAGITVADLATLAVLFDGGAGRDQLNATYIGEVDGHCSFYLHGDLHSAGGFLRDRVSIHTFTKAGSAGTLYDYALGGDGNDVLKVVAEGDTGTAYLFAYGGSGFDECTNTFNVQVQDCEA